MDGDAQLSQSLRETDRDRYLTTLYAPADKRAALTTLYAFNAEIASIRDKIREPMAGEVRLQWWRDAIAAGSDATGNPLADALTAIIAEHRLPQSAFDRMLEARIFDLYDDPMPDRTTLEGYCGETASTLIQLAALILEPEEGQRWANAAGHAGCAQAIAGLLRLLPLHRARGQCFVPVDVLTAAGTNPTELIAGDNPDGAARAVEAMVALAREHHAAFVKNASGLPQSLRPAFLPVAPVPASLKAIGVKPQRPLEQTLGSSPARTNLAILNRALRGW